MYRGYADAFNGIARSVFGAVGGRISIVLGLVVAIGVFILNPVFQLAADFASNGVVFSPALFPVGLFLLIWSMTLQDRNLPVGYSLLYPIAFINLIFIATVSAIRTGFGSGIEWKGRLVRCGNPDLPDPYILNAITIYRLCSFVVYSTVLVIVMIYNKLVFGLRVRGRDILFSIPGGFFLISNHTLYLDPALVAHAIFPRRAYFSALEETFDLPILGGFIRLLGAFPIPHNCAIPRILPAIEWALRRGRCVHFFPEGELTHYAKYPASFKSGVFYLASRLDVPVVPVTLIVQDRKFFGLRPGKPFVRVTVDIGEPMFPRQFSVEASTREAVRKMAHTARERMKVTLEETTDV